MTLPLVLTPEPLWQVPAGTRVPVSVIATTPEGDPLPDGAVRCTLVHRGMVPPDAPDPVVADAPLTRDADDPTRHTYVLPKLSTGGRYRLLVVSEPGTEFEKLVTAKIDAVYDGGSTAAAAS